MLLKVCGAEQGHDTHARSRKTWPWSMGHSPDKIEQDRLLFIEDRICQDIKGRVSLCGRDGIAPGEKRIIRCADVRHPGRHGNV